MPQVISTNVMSLTAQRNLNSSQTAQNTAIQRLSSGLRINSAKDDAAGLAISERMSAQIRGMSVAQRNAQDGISLAQTAEGALGTVGNNLQRIRELAVQSANATNSASDRAALNTEAQQLMKEVDRVAKSTTFNGVSLLDGSFQSQTFQVGAGAGQSITVDRVADARVSSLGNTHGVTTAAAIASPAADIDLSKIDITGANGKKVTLEGTIKSGTAAGDAAAQLADAINSVASQTGVQALVKDTGEIELSSSLQKAFKVDDGNAAPALGAAALNSSLTSVGFSDLDLATVNGAKLALDKMDSALATVNNSRANLGAVQNRFDSVITTLQTNSENVSASKSRIMDTDFASETANLTRAQILQQAGTAMLAQANQLPQNVLSLLR